MLKKIIKFLKKLFSLSNTQASYEVAQSIFDLIFNKDFLEAAIEKSKQAFLFTFNLTVKTSNKIIKTGVYSMKFLTNAIKATNDIFFGKGEKTIPKQADEMNLKTTGDDVVNFFDNEIEEGFKTTTDDNVNFDMTWFEKKGVKQVSRSRKEVMEELALELEEDIDFKNTKPANDKVDKQLKGKVLKTHFSIAKNEKKAKKIGYKPAPSFSKPK